MTFVYFVERVNDKQAGQELSAPNAAKDFQYGKTTLTIYNKIRQPLIYIRRKGNYNRVSYI